MLPEVATANQSSLGGAVTAACKACHVGRTEEGGWQMPTPVLGCRASHQLVLYCPIDNPLPSHSGWCCLWYVTVFNFLNN